MITEPDGLSKGYSSHANTVENDRELSCRARSVYDRILHKAERKTGRARFNYDRITELEECSPRTLARAFAKLEQRGHIWRKFTGRGYIFYITAISGPKPEAVESRETRRVDKAESGRSALTPVAGQSGQRRLGQEIRAAMGVHSALTPVSTLLDKNSSNKKDYMHEETSASNSNSMSAIKQLSMSESNSEDMNSCNSRQEEEVFEKLEEEDSFKNFGEQDGMRDLLTQVSKDHMPKFHIPTSGEHDDEHDGMGDSLRESMSHGPKTSEAPKRRIKQWEKWRSVEKPILEIPPDELRSSMPENSLAKIHLSPNHPLEKVNAMKERALDTLVESELLTIGQCHAFLYGDFRKQPDIERQGAWIAGLLKRMVRNRKGQTTVAQFFACCKQARRPGCPQTDLSIVESLIPNAELVGSK
jgi:hypothetical protein